MEFDKSKVYTALNADELKVGSTVFVADTLEELKIQVESNKFEPVKLSDVNEAANIYRFVTDTASYCLAYLVKEPAKLQWTDLKIGDVITNDKVTAMVTGIFPDGSDMHIHAHEWLSDRDLDKWRRK